MRKHDLTKKKDKDKDNDKHIKKTPSKSYLWDLYGLWDIFSEWWENKKTMKKTNANTTTNTKAKTFRERIQMTMLEKLWNCWHYWQLRTSNHYNHSDLTIKSDTGQHLQFLFLQSIVWGPHIFYPKQALKASVNAISEQLLGLHEVQDIYELSTRVHKS